MTALKYTPRIAFNAGLAVSQISEFSLIIALLAFQSGIIDSGVISLLTLVMLLTITMSSYIFYHSDQLYKLCSPFLLKINKHKFNHDERIGTGLEVLISGLSIKINNSSYTKLEGVFDSNKIKELSFNVVEFGPNNNLIFL
jgi:Kef-type K+ transport system membrane component KefB